MLIRTISELRPQVLVDYKVKFATPFVFVSSMSYPKD
jgi:hypothetical protein